MRERDELVDEKRKNLELLEAVKEKRAAELRLNKAEEKIRRLANSSPDVNQIPDGGTSTSAYHPTAQ